MLGLDHILRFVSVDAFASLAQPELPVSESVLQRNARLDAL